MRKIILYGLVLLTAVAACKKDEEEEAPAIQGRWSIENYIEREFDNGQWVTDDTIPGFTTDFVEFQSNGKVIASVFGMRDTSDYRVIPGNKLIMDGDTVEMRNLSSAKVTLYSKEVFSATNYSEVFINLKK